MVTEVSSKLSSVRIACAKHGVRRLWLFGSALGVNENRFRPDDSDVDLVVEFVPTTQRLLADPFFDLLQDLEAILGRRVQMMTDRSIQNPVLRAEIDATKELIYAAAGQEAAA